MKRLSLCRNWQFMPHSAPILSGVYVAIFDLPRPRTIAIGRLGRFRFSAGRYLYVGSAQRNLQQRLARHARRRKPLRWHIDYLACQARFVGALIFEAPGDLECRLAAMLARSCARPVDGFGASDCRCGGHLFFTNAQPGKRTGQRAPTPARRLGRGSTSSS
jgi:sugar fermentation stimulation protein A